MADSALLIDILHHLGGCLGAEAEAPGAWRSLGETLLQVPEIRGMAAFVWAAGEPPLVLGELTCPLPELAAALRHTPWEYRDGGTPVAVTLPLPGPHVAAPLGTPGEVRGAIFLAAHEAGDRLRALAALVATGLTVALQSQQAAREARQLHESLRAQFTGIGEFAAVSQLAASVAHELRNPLSSIKGAAQYLRNEYHEQNTIREFLDIILEEVGVLSRITTEFLDFARPMHLNLQEAHLHDSIRRLLQLVKPQMTSQGIEVITDLGPDVPATVFDAPQVEHVLRNIVINAIQAMPEGGTLLVRTRYATAPLPTVEIAVSDTGTGIAAEDLGRLFAPFFTTKTKGVGLGLTIVQKIVQNHGGSLGVESQPGVGSTFTIRLPSIPGAESLRVAGQPACGS
ncbi:MAG: hypothetical protein GX774_01250 [Armatimonadetes bacterium]|nr:hypothetical protein [Armatimonadota bacterium]